MSCEMDREQMLWRRPSPEERRQQLSDDLRRISGFLTVVVAEAEHLNASWEFMLHGRVPSQGWVADRWRTGCRSATAPGSGDGVRPPVGVGQQLHQVWRWWAWV